MNDARRKKLKCADNHLADARDLIEQVYDDESMALESIPENFQYSPRYEEASEKLDSLYEALDSIDEVRDVLNEII